MSLEFQSALLEEARRMATESLQNAQDDPESSMLRNKDEEKSCEIYKKVQGKYSDQLKSTDPVKIEEVVKSLSEYIVREKLGNDPLFLTDASYRAASPEDFRVDDDGVTKQLNERGQYKAALRATLDEIPQTRIGDPEQVHFGTCLHPHSELSIGPEAVNARELLAHMWLAVSDPEIEFIEGKEKEMGGRDQCQKAEKENFINTLAAIQRAHNDGSYAPVDRLLDNPSCVAGVWGRIFKEGSLSNKLTHFHQSEDKKISSPVNQFEFNVASEINKIFQTLTSQQQLEFMNNYYGVYVNGEDPHLMKGYTVGAFAEKLKKVMNDKFEEYWDNLTEADPALKQMKDNSSLLSLRSTYTPVIKYHKEYYRLLWEAEIRKIENGELQQQRYFEPFEQHTFESHMAISKEAAIAEVESHVGQEKSELENVVQKLVGLRGEIDTLHQNISSEKNATQIKLYQGQLLVLSSQYNAMMSEKNKLIEKIENETKKIVAEKFISGMDLLNQERLDKKESSSPIAKTAAKQQEEPQTKEENIKAQSIKPGPVQKSLLDTAYNNVAKNWKVEWGKISEEKRVEKAIESVNAKVEATKAAHLELKPGHIAWFKNDKLGTKEEKKGLSKKQEEEIIDKLNDLKEKLSGDRITNYGIGNVITSIEAIYNEHLDNPEIKKKSIKVISQALYKQASREMSLMENESAEVANVHRQNISQIYDKIKKFGVEFSHDFHLEGPLKKELDRMSVTPPWLVNLQAQMEDCEGNIRLTAGSVQHQLSQGMLPIVNKKLEDFVESLETDSTVIDIKNMKKAIERYLELEKEYYELLGDFDINKESLTQKITEIEEIKGTIHHEIGLVQTAFIESAQFEFSLTSTEKDFINEFLATTFYPGIPPYSPSLLVQRAEYIIDCERNQTNVFAQTNQELQEAINKFAKGIADAKNQVAESVDPRKPQAKAAKQLAVLTQAETELRQVQDMLAEPQPNKGTAYYQFQAQHALEISENLHQNLASIGSVQKASSAIHVFKSAVNKIRALLGIDKVLNKKEVQALKQFTSEIQKVMEDEGPEKQRVRQKMLFLHKKEAQRLKFSKSDIQDALTYVNTHLNVKDLGLNQEGLKEFLKQGVNARIKPFQQAPITIEFKTLDNTQHMSVEISSHLFKEYIKKEKEAQAAPSASRHKPSTN